MADEVKPTPAAAASREAEAPAEVPSCNLPGCPEAPVTRGLCDVHWSTHRGKADPDDGPADSSGPEATLP
jgi:hypothetical protein